MTERSDLKAIGLATKAALGARFPEFGNVWVRMEDGSIKQVAILTDLPVSLFDRQRLQEIVQSLGDTPEAGILELTIENRKVVRVEDTLLQKQEHIRKMARRETETRFHDEEWKNLSGKNPSENISQNLTKLISAMGIGSPAGDQASEPVTSEKADGIG